VNVPSLEVVIEMKTMTEIIDITAKRHRWKVELKKILTYTSQTWDLRFCLQFDYLLLPIPNICLFSTSSISTLILQLSLFNLILVDNRRRIQSTL
jgi:hypothetical protein